MSEQSSAPEPGFARQTNTRDAVTQRLASDAHKGLSSDEFARRLAAHGPNSLPQSRRARRPG